MQSTFVHFTPEWPQVESPRTGISDKNLTYYRQSLKWEREKREKTTFLLAPSCYMPSVSFPDCHSHKSEVSILPVYAWYQIFSSSSTARCDLLAYSVANILTAITSPAPGSVRFCLEAQVYHQVYISAKS